MRFALVGPELEENLGLRYLHASATRAGHDGRIFHFHTAEQTSALAQAIVAWDVQMVGLSMVFTARAREFVELARALRTAGYRGFIAAGGHFASFHAPLLLRDAPEIDFVVHGEGERVFTALLDSPETPASIKGISYRAANGACRRTARQSTDYSLDDLPTPTRTPPFQRYLGKPVAAILGSRGCSGRCNFCSIAAWFDQNGGRRFRQRAEGAIAAEMASLYHEYGVRVFNFHDDNFFTPREIDNCIRIGRLADALGDLAVTDIAVQVKSRVDTITPAVLDSL